jgi:PRTRC genetic system protein B
MQQPAFKIRSQTGGTLRLTQAVLIYQGDHDSALATVHNVEDVDGQPVILAGQAMTPRAANQLSRALSKSVSHGGFLPETVLYTDGELLMWWVPPAKRHIVFKADELKTKWGTAERGEVVPHPGLVFATSNTIWKVWAVKGSSRPSLDTQLFHAPYFNVWEQGDICRGNVKVPDGTTAERIDAWNTAFLGSIFTHPNGVRQLVTYRGGAYRLWLDLLNGKYRKFPERVLNDANTTLGKLLGLTNDAGRNDERD